LALLVALLLAVPLLAAEAQTPPPWAHPAKGVVTGVAGVDAALRAMETSDATALQSQFLFTSRPCTERGLGEVRCPEGQPVGTPVEVFSIGQCEGVNVERGDPALANAAQAMTNRTEFLFAIARLDNQFPPSTFALFFGTENDPGTATQLPVADQAVVIFADAGGIRAVNTGCASSVAQRVADLAPSSFLVAPRTSPPGPPDTGSGMVEAGPAPIWPRAAGLAVALAGLMLALVYARQRGMRS
jgi:hypothetical protein